MKKKEEEEGVKWLRDAYFLFLSTLNVKEIFHVVAVLVSRECQTHYTAYRCECASISIFQPPRNYSFFPAIW